MAEPPKVQYNFEEMIEKALKEKGDAIGLEESKRKSLATKRSKTTRNKSDSDDENQEEEFFDAKTVKNSKKANLKKR
jgi:low affinity Fe/Cu permease